MTTDADRHGDFLSLNDRLVAHCRLEDKLKKVIKKDWGPHGAVVTHPNQDELVTDLTRKAGGHLNLESRLCCGSGPPKSRPSSRGLRYSSSDVMGLLMSTGTPRLPLRSCTGSVTQTVVGLLAVL